jgi:hypothetical protein
VTDPHASIESHTRALLQLVDAYRTRECVRALAGASDTASSLLRDVRVHARAVARRAFDESRARREGRLAAATAEVTTRHRVAEQHRLSALLAQGARMLPEALAARWQDPAQRAQWVAHVAREAQGRLPRGAWHILHAGGLTDEERASLARTLDAPPEFVLDPTIRAGLRIGAPPNVIDGTLEGLLIDRAEIEAQLLVELSLKAQREEVE